MDIKLFIQKMKEAGFTQTEIFKSRVSRAKVQTKNAELDEYNISLQNRYSIKGEWEGCTVKARTNRLTEEMIELLKEKAIYQENKDSDYFTVDQSYNCTCESDEELQAEKVLDELKSVSALPIESPAITQNKMGYEETITEIGYYNSNGVVLEEVTHCYDYIITVVAKDGDKNATHYIHRQVVSKDAVNLADMREMAIEECLRKLDAHPISSRKTKAILNANTMSQLLNGYISIFYADEIQKGNSRLEGKKGQQLFSPKVNITEEPNNKNLIGYRSFDDEGTKTIDKFLVKDGIVVDYIYDNKTALKENRTSTGNSYGMIATSNAYLYPEELTLEELIQEMQDGIVITDVIGLHAGVDTVSGDFSLQAEGYWIQGGVRTDTVMLIVISGNIYELLQKVIMIGNDLYFRTKHMGSPSVLFESVNVSGSDEKL